MMGGPARLATYKYVGNGLFAVPLSDPGCLKSAQVGDRRRVNSDFQIFVILI